ncbi:DUF2911 domain-containing protein [Algoriphagus sp.]|uniref:DUF2911 domain-containing protein n=1 Tax=Algoriphagus sp. TaxID=1872435 RepID=UPI00271B7535|nr:DUF2911 domain-containing protein [Algoriphagus sp.]MDO8965028.1 DUF2911 domain-containing protein [Algoriphagus sp.]MDP3201258.1 DUF2911 domain-containing protein [Algoriphagus sp.]
MKYSPIISAIFLLVAISCSPKTESETLTAEDHSQHQTATAPTASKSPKTEAMAMVGGNHIHIDYSSPSVRGRQIFGGLVGFGEVWSTGAHKATSIKFDKNVLIGGKEIPAGKYGFFTIPGETEWTLILNKVWDMHLADDYNPAEDIIRMTVTPEILTETVESLTYTVTEKSANTAEISMAWDKTKVSFEVINK